MTSGNSLAPFNVRRLRATLSVGLNAMVRCATREPLPSARRRPRASVIANNHRDAADEPIARRQRDFTRDPIQERLMEHASVLGRQIRATD